MFATEPTSPQQAPGIIDATLRYRQVTIALTLIGIVMTGCTIGSLLPLVLKRFGVDPATSSTPFIASLVDVLGIIIFVQIAKIVLSQVIAHAAHAAPALCP